jgi:broad specificity phosphatase PhoE
MPSFDVVRVEPSGDAVIAGVAAPGSMVEVLDDGKPVARAKANESGDWALALDRPLAPGTHDLAIRTTSGDQTSMTLSDQRVAVVTHGGVIAALLAMATGSRPFAFLGADNASISRLVITPQRWILRGYNDTAHLD